MEIESSVVHLRFNMQNCNRYFPENFFKSTSESQSKFDPKKACFKNSSGNIIIGSKNTQFKLGPDDRLIKNELIDNTEILDNCIEYEETD